jgi:aryl-alcohol dehydrogenase-like predicted oxidoreductase
MRYGTVTGLGQQVSRLVLGTAIFSTDRPDQAFSVLDTYVDSGGNGIDTAHIYGVDGTSSLRAADLVLTPGECAYLNLESDEVRG